jgi:hypothetical protein
MIGWGRVIAGESRKLGRTRTESEANESKIGGAYGREEGKKRKQWMLSGEVRDSPFPFLRFIDLGEPRSRELRALRTINAGNAIRR